MIFANHQTFTAPNLTIVGNHNIIQGSNCIVAGNHNRVSGSNCRVTGNHNSLNGPNANATGNHNTLAGPNSAVTGDYNRLYGPNCTAQGNNNHGTTDGGTTNGGRVTIINRIGGVNFMSNISNVTILNGRVFINGVDMTGRLNSSQPTAAVGPAAAPAQDGDTATSIVAAPRRSGRRRAANRG